MGCDVCYTNHAEADQDDMDMLLTLLAAAGVNFIMGVPGADDVMLDYQSTSFHDALALARCWACGPRPNSRPGCKRKDFSTVPPASVRQDFHDHLLFGARHFLMPDPNA